MSNFNTVADAIEKIGAVSSRTSKIFMLKEYAALVGFKEILQFIFDPYTRTGIGKVKLNKKGLAPINVPVSWQDFINHFKAHQTGSDADVAMAQSFIAQQTSNAARLLAIAMATKDLKVGLTETTLNQVYGDTFIPKTGIMRAQHYSDNKNVIGPFIVTEKLDGGRRLIVKENGIAKLYTRSGHLDEGLVEIEAECQHLPNDSVFDTELLAIGEFANAIELRQASNAIANSKGIRRGATLNIFDFMPLSEYKFGVSKEGADLRKIVLGAMFGDHSIEHIAGDATGDIINKFKIPYDFKFLKTIPILGVVNTEEEIMAIAQPIWDRGFEGVMLNVTTGTYVVSPNPQRQILKVKATEEFKLKVTGVYEGEGNFTGMLGGVYIDYRGQQLGCGSGFNKQQRIHFWNNPGAIIGMWVEGDSFGESTNKQGGTALNCPIFKRLVGDTE